jgi:hypothetical protein
MAVSFIPIVGPILSCVIDGTFVDMWNAIKSGDWATFGMCALSFVPGGKSAKLGLKGLLGVGGGLGSAGLLASKMAKGSKGIIKQGGGATADNFRKRLVAATGVNPKGMDAHHMLPKSRADYFDKKFGINAHDTKWGAWWDSTANRGRSTEYNTLWDAKIASGGLNTAGDVESYALQMAKHFNIKWP